MTQLEGHKIENMVLNNKDAKNILESQEKNEEVLWEVAEQTNKK